MFTPPFPIVSDIMAPLREPSWNILLFKGFLKFIVRWKTILFPSTKTFTYDDFSLTVAVDKPTIILVPDII